jgi:hypothetical protein
VMHTHRSKVVSRTSSGMGETPALSHHPSEEFLEESERAWFSGTGDNNLTDSIRLVQLGHQDAVVRVRTHEGHEGTLWCRQGDIIDAACDGLGGEDAVYRALSWQGGKVSVDFGLFSHERHIETPTSGLLLEAANREASTRTQQLPWKSRRSAVLLFAVAGAILLLVLVAGVLWKQTRIPPPRTADQVTIREISLTETRFTRHTHTAPQPPSKVNVRTIK